jgi:hypothetical protein
VIGIGCKRRRRPDARGYGKQQADSSQMLVHRVTFMHSLAFRHAYPQHDPGNCERSMRAMIDRSSLRTER